MSEVYTKYARSFAKNESAQRMARISEHWLKWAARHKAVARERAVAILIRA